MPQNTLVDIAPTAMRIDERAVSVFGNGIDCQIAPQQIIFYRDVRRKVELEPVVARRCLAFGSGECVFLIGFWVQEYREVFADLSIASVEKLSRCGAHGAPVPLRVRNAELLITNSTTDEIHLH